MSKTKSVEPSTPKIIEFFKWDDAEYSKRLEKETAIYDAQSETLYYQRPAKHITCKGFPFFEFLREYEKHIAEGYVVNKDRHYSVDGLTSITMTKPESIIEADKKVIAEEVKAAYLVDLEEKNKFEMARQIDIYISRKQREAEQAVRDAEAKLYDDGLADLYRAYSVDSDLK